MCLKVWVSVALYFVCLLTLTDGFFLPVFVRKQHPQTPALNNPQWTTSYQSTGSVPPLSSSSGNGNVNMNGIGGSAGPSQQQQPPPSSNTYKEYNPYQQAQGVVTPLHQVQIPPLHPQYGYDSGVGGPAYQVGPYPQYQSAFHSVQLVPCLCPISKDVIDQQAQPFQHLQPIQSGSSSSSSSSPSSSVESGSNDVLTKGGQKLGS